MGRGPGASLMRELEGRAEALAGTFNAQDVANTLWAYATMGRGPGEPTTNGRDSNADGAGKPAREDPGSTAAATPPWTAPPPLRPPLGPRRRRGERSRHRPAVPLQGQHSRRRPA